MISRLFNPPRPPSADAGVLQVLPRLEADALGRTALDLARHLRRRGWRAFVASAGGPLQRELAAVGATHVPLPLDEEGRLARWRNRGRLAGLIRAHRIGLVHAHAEGPARIAAQAARRTGAAFVATCHALDADGRCPDAIAVAGRVIAVSEFVGERLSQGRQVESERLRVVRAWIDPEELDPARVRGHRVVGLAERCGLTGTSTVILVPGPLAPTQGHLLLLEALAGLDRDDFLVLLAGAARPDDRHVKAIQTRARKAGLADRLRFAGAVADLPALLALADLVVLPAIHPAPSGYLAAAAQAMGKPVIVTDQGALAEAVMPAATGWLVPAGSAGELSRAIGLALALDPSVRERLASRARAFVLATFGMEALCERTLDVYRELLVPAGAALPATRRPVLEAG